MLPLLMWEVIPLLSQENLWRNCRAVPALKRKEKHIRKTDFFREYGKFPNSKNE